MSQSWNVRVCKENAMIRQLDSLYRQMQQAYADWGADPTAEAYVKYLKLREQWHTELDRAWPTLVEAA